MGCSGSVSTRLAIERARGTSPSSWIMTAAEIGGMIVRVVTEAEAALDRLNGLQRIGIDEVSHRKGQRYLTVVVDHDSRRDRRHDRQSGDGSRGGLGSSEWAAADRYRRG